MLRNYWKLAVRNLARHRGFAAINIFGLALGMGSFLLICLHLTDEWSFDRFHPDADRTYRLYEETLEGENAGQKVVPVSLQVAVQVTDHIPEVEASVTMFNFGRRTMHHLDRQFYEPIIYTQSSFFEVFGYPLLQGDPSTLLDRPFTVVLSESAAKKYYGRTDVVGEMLGVNDWEAEVTGVYADFPNNTHLEAPMLFSMGTAQAQYSWWDAQLSNDWKSNNFVTYVKLVPEAETASVAQKITSWTADHRADSLRKEQATFLQPITDIHLYSADMEAGFNATPGNPAYMKVFVLVAFFILLVASINYTNLATALASKRAREVGLRKVMGSHRHQLIGQFLLESLLLASLSLIIGFSLVQLALPAYNQWSGKELQLNLVHWDVYALLASIVVGVALLAGSYPAFYLSRFSPVAVLKGNLQKGRRRLALREILVIAQFGISGLLLAGTAIMFQQLKYLEDKELGFEDDQQLVVDINSGVARNQFETFKTAFNQIPAVNSVSVSSRVPGEWKDFPMAQVQHPTQPEEQMDMIYVAADWDFLETFDIELLDGRNFTPSPADSGTVLINQAAAKLLGIEQIEEQTLDIVSATYGTQRRQGEEPFKVRVIGLINDFHFESLRQTMKPLVVSYYANPIHVIDYFTLRYSPDTDPQALLAEVSEAYLAIDPDNPLEYNFLNERVGDDYQADRRNGQLVGWFAGLGLVIACMGLFALASLAIQQRIKEVAIRKVLGSSRTQLVSLLSKDFLKLVGIALVVAVPLAIWLIQPWLNSFAYRVQISAFLLLCLSMGLLFIALLTVSVRTFRAASQNPGFTLRNE